MIRSHKHRRDHVTWLAYGLVAAYSLMLNLLGPALPFLQREQHSSYLMGSAHTRSLAISLLIVCLGLPQLVGRLGRWVVAALGVGGLIAAGLLLAGAAHPTDTVLGAMAIGAGSALLMDVAPAVFADRHPEWRVVVLSEAAVGASLSETLAPLLVGICNQLGIGWRGGVLTSIACFEEER